MHMHCSFLPAIFSLGVSEVQIYFKQTPEITITIGMLFSKRSVKQSYRNLRKFCMF